MFLGLPTYGQAPLEFWVSPTGANSGLGNNATNAAKFNLATLQSDWLGNTQKQNIIIYFCYSDQPYDIVGPAGNSWTQRLVIDGDLNRTVQLIGLLGPDGKRPRLRMLPMPAGSGPANSYYPSWPPVSEFNDWLLKTRTTSPDLAGHKVLGRVVVENLELDGNFEGMGALTSVANDEGYRSFGMELWATTGRVKNVVVRNFGAVGVVPQSTLEGSQSGIETFPLMVVTDARTPRTPASDNDRWIVEDSTVTDFYSVHGGYATLLLAAVIQPTPPNVYPPIDYNPPIGYNTAASPLVIVRRCLVEGTGALGTAGTFAPTGQILFKDNVILNSQTAFNMDTHWGASIDLINNVALDVTTFAKIGTANQSVATMRYFQFLDNLIRLRGRTQAKVYTDYDYQTASSSWLTAPDQPLGRLQSTLCFGLALRGIAADIKFSNNRFTTVHASKFLPAGFPSDATGATFQMVWPVPSNTYINNEYVNTYRGNVRDIKLQTGRLSAVAYDFIDPAGPYPDESFLGTNTLEPTEAPNYTQVRSPSGSGFESQGILRRTLQNYQPGPAPIDNLLSVEEIAIGTTSIQTSASSATLTAQVRAAEHRTSYHSTPGTAAIVGRTVRLRYFVNGATVPTDVTVAPQTITGGFASFTIGSLPLNANVRLEAWMEPAGGSGTFHRDRVAWATCDVPIGVVVSVTALPDVGDDKNTLSSKRAKFRFTRTGSTQQALSVGFLLAPSYTAPNPQPGPEELIATYGTSGTADYYLQGVGNATLWPTSGVPSQVTFPAGATEAVVDVVTRGDNLTEQDIVRVILQSGSGYALGSRSTADVLIYDGPYWTLQSLEPTATESAATAVNGTKNAAGAWIAPPQAVGWGVWTVYGLPETHGSLWNTGSSPPWLDFGLTFRPYGISSRASTQQNSVVVGTLGSSAYKILDNGTGGMTLPNFSWPGGGSPSAARAISPNAGRIVGYSTSSGKGRPALWVGSSNPIDLSGGLEDPQNQRIGEAMAVNDAGVVVGYCSGFGPDIQGKVLRSFRNDGSDAVFDDTDALAVPSDGSGAGAANAVSTTSQAQHFAAGWYSTISGSSRLGLQWSPSAGQSLPSVPKLLGVLYRNGAQDIQNEAKGINESLRIVGWSGASAVDSNRKAVMYDGGWKDLNDRHFVHGSTGWVLQSAEGISKGNVIVGNGLLLGAPKAFMLLPRTDEN